MDTLTWQSRLETGHRSLDSEHQQDLRHIIGCIKSARSGATRDELIAQLNAIYERIAAHFSNEEHLMRIASNELFVIHKVQHDCLLDDLNLKISNLAESESIAIPAQRILFSLHNWYLNHIERGDKMLVNQAKAIALTQLIKFREEAGPVQSTEPDKGGSMKTKPGMADRFHY